MKPICANGLLLISALAWGASNVSQKTILEHLGPFTVTGLTSLVGALVILPFAFQERQRAAIEKQCNTGKLLPVLALFALSICLLQTGYGLTSVTNAGFVVNTSAVLTPIFSWLLFADRPQLLIWPASFLALGGIWLLGGGILTSVAVGDWVCLAAAVSFALWYPLAGRVLVESRAPYQLTVLQFLFTGVLCTALGLAVEPLSGEALLLSMPDLLIVGLISKGLAYVLQSIGQQHTSPSTAAIIVSAEAVFGAASAQVMLGETLSPTGLIGAGMILSAIALAQTGCLGAKFRRPRCEPLLSGPLRLKSRGDTGERAYKTLV